GSALTAAVGKAIGAGRKNIAIKQTSICLKIALAYMGLIGLCFFVFRNPVMKFWSSDVKVIEAGVNLLICAAIYQCFYAARIIYSGSLRGAGDTVWLAGMSATGAIVILGLGGFLISEFFPQFGAVGPWLGATLSVIAVGLANRWRFKSNRWQKIDLFKHRPAVVAMKSEAAVE
ncbi:MAG: MATE family efflux transporter, partial [Planctomycetota bacterium]